MCVFLSKQSVAECIQLCNVCNVSVRVSAATAHIGDWFIVQLNHSDAISSPNPSLRNRVETGSRVEDTGLPDLGDRCVSQARSPEK